MKKLNIKLKKPDFRALRVRKPQIKRGWLIFAVVSLAMCLAALGCAAALKATGNTLKSQQAAQRWAGESGVKYAQISVFAPKSGSFDKMKIMAFREKVRTATADTLPKTVKNAMTDAWSAAGKVSIRGAHGSADASVIAVGGNYFYFHPLDIISGGYFSDSDLMNDRVLLDEELAWKLYGGSDLTGLTVTIDNTPFVVSGVVKREGDFADKAAYTAGAGLYMSFDAYNALLAASAPTTPPTDTSGAASSGSAAAPTPTTPAAPVQKAAISCYEAVLPNPVKGFAQNLVASELNADKSCEIVENSARYTTDGTWGVLKNFGKRTLHTDAIELPYWENAARLVENRCALFLLLELIFWLCPVVFACIMLVKLFKYLRLKLREKYLDLKDRYENRTLFHSMKGSDDNGGTDA